MNTAWNIELKNLSLAYGERLILNSVSGQIPAGKITMILGGSGCGKSTLLRNILGLKRPSSGSVIIGGKDFFNLSAANFRRTRRHMGVLFQDGALLGSLTLAANVALPLTEHTNLSKKLIRELVFERLKLVGLEDFLDYYPGQLSGGMRKRAALARAIVVNPQILLCDEPSSGLDPITAAKMDELLLSLKEQFTSMTIVVVSHDLPSMEAIADNVLLLNEGQILFQGSKDELKLSQDPYIKSFLNRQNNATKIKTNENKTGNEKLNLNPIIQEHIDKWLNQ